jgi:hypothetical protein
MFDNVIREDLLRDALTPPAAEAEYNYEGWRSSVTTYPTFPSSKSDCSDRRCYLEVFDLMPRLHARLGTQSHLHAHRRDIINNKALYQARSERRTPPVHPVKEVLGQDVVPGEYLRPGFFQSRAKRRDVTHPAGQIGRGSGWRWISRS